MRAMLPEAIYEKPIDTKEKCVYLTFDDGPIPAITPFVLDLLVLYQAKATFFVVGENVHKHPEIFEMVKAAGHTIGSHTYNHLNGYKTEIDDYVANTMKAATLVSSHLFRPPYGRIRKKQAAILNENGLQIVMWSLLSGDFDPNISAEKCLQNVISNIKPGDIVVFHDSLKAASHLKYVLPKVLEFCKNQQWEMKAL